MLISWPARNRKFTTFDALAVVGLVGLLTARFIPIAKLIPFWGCAFRTVTGFPCPGCGLTRVADYFSHFNFYGAFKANPLGSMAAATFAALMIGSALHFAFKVPWPEVELNDRDWTRLRNLAILAFVVNYAFVILQHRLVLL